MATNWMGGIVIAVVGGSLALARKYLPQTKPVSEEVAVDAAGKQPYVVTAMLGVAIAIAAVSYFALLEGNKWMAARDGSPVLTLRPGLYLWMFSPLFGSLSLAWGVTLWIWSLFAGKEEPRAYAVWSDKKSGFKCTTILLWMAWLIGVPVGIANFLAVPVHANLSDDGISIGRYAQWSPERHAYADVQQFLLIKGYVLKDGSFDSQPRIVLKFADGKEWSSWDTREDDPVNPAMLTYLTTKLGRQPEVMETE